MSELVAERDVMILRHISIIVTGMGPGEFIKFQWSCFIQFVIKSNPLSLLGIRAVGEPRLMEENFRNIILEKPLEYYIFSLF